MDQQDFEGQEDIGTGGKIKNWIQDNIRIIISILIVIAIAGGIYSYSNRGQAPSEGDLALEEEFNMTQEEVIEDGQGDEQDNQEEETQNGNKEDENQDSELQEESQEESRDEEVKVETEEEEPQTTETISEETEEAFIQTAVRGDSQTTLARKALADYLEKNNDSELTAEHKVYIEDYLRKNVDNSDSLNVGEKMTFSKTLIKDSIEKSKTLTESQLENLKKYSARVPSLR
ncbi:MAG: hypothetical protein R6V40_02900 [Candidatus Moraniibacteriota bacterium]